ncbi:MAG TPA: hypothetical protein PKK06_05320 [Phycisphaerae bacterium]|nr:hypothetical protein [Phycisphaerae bacterium]HNU44823.1 hypothetical protein [Phycisphaerae bacterium]
MSDPTFWCYEYDGPCDWRAWPNELCTQNYVPLGGASLDGHRQARRHPNAYSGDADGVDRTPWSCGRFAYIGAPPGPHGVPEGNEVNGDTRVIFAIATKHTPDGQEYDEWSPYGSECSGSCGHFEEWSGRAVLQGGREYQQCTRRKPWPPSPFYVPVFVRCGARMSQRGMGFIQHHPCMVTPMMHRCWGKSAQTGDYFIAPHQHIFNYFGFDLGNAAFRDVLGAPGRNPTIVAIKNAALALVSSLHGPNMDRLDHYGENYSYQHYKQGWWERAWPAEPMAWDEWPTVRQLNCRLAKCGHAFTCDLVLKYCRVWLELTLLNTGQRLPGGGLEPHLYAAAEFGAQFELGVRRNIGTAFPHFDPLVYLTRSWLPPEDPRHQEEVYFLGPDPCTPGLYGSGASQAWSVEGERVLFLDDNGRPFTPPWAFEWEGQLGHDTDPPWPDIVEGTQYDDHLVACCAVGCNLLDFAVPARASRKTGATAPEVWEGSVQLRSDPSGLLRATCGGC